MQPTPAVPDNSGDWALMVALYSFTGGPDWSGNTNRMTQHHRQQEV